MGLLRRILDDNKRVQEAACSAFATLEEVLTTISVDLPLKISSVSKFLLNILIFIFNLLMIGSRRRAGTALGNHIKASNGCIWEVSGDFLTLAHFCFM